VLKKMPRGPSSRIRPPGHILREAEVLTTIGEIFEDVGWI
jgi:hypothetical protein